MSKNKENLSEVDAAYKEELDSLVLDLLNRDLCSPESESILLKLVDHATNDFGNISTIPKSLQFLISHKVALDEYYKRYTLKNGQDNFPLVLLLEIISFLDAINLNDSANNGNSGEDHGSTKVPEAPSFKLLLYKLEANLIAQRLTNLVSSDSHAETAQNSLKNGVNNVNSELGGDTTQYKHSKTPVLSEVAKKMLTERKVSDWGNEYLISLSSQIVSYYSTLSTRQFLSNNAINVSNLNNNTVNFPDSVNLVNNADGVKKTVVGEVNTGLVIFESLKLIEEMTSYWLANGFEFDAIDLLLEVDRIESLEDKCSDDYDLVTRVSSYLAAVSAYGATLTETCRILTVTYNILLRNCRYLEATRVALKLNQYDKVIEVLNKCKDINTLKQIALFLGSNHLFIPSLTDASSNTGMNLDIDIDYTVVYLNSGENRSSLFLSLCKELDILDPKHPNDVFKGYPSKSNLNLTQSISGVSIDSARDNLSYTFVNSFINCASSKDKLITTSTQSDKDSSATNEQESSKDKSGEPDFWLFKHQGYGLLCASASLGLIHLWNLDEGLSEIDKYQYSTDQYIRSGSYFAFGLVSCGVASELDPVQGLLVDKLDSTNFLERLGAILGLTFAYSGTNRNDMLELLTPHVVDLSSIECSLFSSLALSVIFVGTGNQESSEAILQVLIEYISSHTDSTPNLKYVRMYLCSLGLLQMCRGELCEPVLDALSVLGKYEKVAVTLVESFAYATSGDVLKVQTLLKNCSATSSTSTNASNTTAANTDSDTNTNTAGNIDGTGNIRDTETNATGTTNVNSTKDTNAGETNTNSGANTNGNTDNTNAETSNSGGEGNAAKEDNSVDNELYGVSILCISLLSMGESIGSSMLVRLLEHPLQCGTVHERRAVPLAIALVNVSNPAPAIVSALSKLSHDTDKDVSLCAILGLGLVGAGTNNSRISQLLQNIAKHSYRDSTLMYVLRISVGLLFMGKGTLTLTPLHSDSFILNKTSLAGLIITLFCALDLRSLVCEEFPFLPFFLALAVRPKWLITLNQDLEVVHIPVRVGTAVDTIGTAGKQRKISGFQTHKSPVLIGVGERAELATEEFETFTPFLEDIVLTTQVSHDH
uniref:26S proteasome regulatory subunit, putative n=1 Tax=Theileria annulata TaxID=5874 RepID=A0A3B0MUU5_THEAN